MVAGLLLLRGELDDMADCFMGARNTDRQWRASGDMLKLALGCSAWQCESGAAVESAAES